MYPDGAPTFWQFLCGRTRHVVVRVRRAAIPSEFCTGDYGEDAAFRSTFQRWLARLWEEKDREIDGLLAREAPAESG